MKTVNIKEVQNFLGKNPLFTGEFTDIQGMKEFFEKPAFYNLCQCP